jgi:hypothetical protein
MAETFENSGIKSWKVIANKINSVFSGIKRTPKQCRERYNNYIKFRNFNNNAAEWTL